jgi:hypothetical protein
MLNPLFDLNKVYIPRSARPEWYTVGLMGIIQVLDDQIVHPNWIKLDKMENISGSTYYLVK